MEDTPESASPLELTPDKQRDWFGIIVALAALCTSLASIWIAVDNANSMDRLVQASSWPYLQIDSSNANDDGEREITLTLANTGIGPLRLESFVVLSEGRPLRNINEMLRQSYDPQWAPATSAEHAAQANSIRTATPGATVLAPGSQTVAYIIPFTDEAAELWQAVNRARFQHQYRACYCSVFNECWTTDFSDTHPTPIQSCASRDDGWRG